MEEFFTCAFFDLKIVRIGLEIRNVFVCGIGSGSEIALMENIGKSVFFRKLSAFF